jgi:hypothetical protein
MSLRFLCRGVVALGLIPFTSTAQAAMHCVRDHNELQQALTAAAASPGDDEIKVREGIYTTFNGTFTYTTQNPGWLTISGGWYTVDGNDCAQMRMDASRTILDGAGQHQVLRILHFPPKGTTMAASFAVVNLSIRNGYGDSATFQRGGGLDIESFSEAYSEARLENLIIANNEGYFGGGANLYVPTGSVRIANSLFADNSATASAFGHAAITVNATPEGVAHAVVVANSTFVHGRCAGQGTRGCGLGAGLAGGVHMDIVNSLFFDNDISDLNLEGGSVIGIGDGTASSDYSLIGTTGGNLPLAASNALSGDPHFVDAANGDWRLRDDSPFINQGLAIVPNSPLIVLDLDANPRSRFGATDAGAYENQTWDFIFADGFEP